MIIRHAKISVKADTPDTSKIQASDWNAEHIVDIGYVDNEVISGTKNGINTAFLLANTPSPVASLQVFLNGVLKANGVGYSLSGRNITMIVEIPFPGDDLRAWYRTST